eukprot:scaffold58370_cov56-Phaeocystis_antarctica.AAC.5
MSRVAGGRRCRGCTPCDATGLEPGCEDAGDVRRVTPQASNPRPAPLAPARSSDALRACGVSCCREAKMQGMFAS